MRHAFKVATEALSNRALLPHFVICRRSAENLTICINSRGRCPLTGLPNATIKPLLDRHSTSTYRASVCKGEKHVQACSMSCYAPSSHPSDIILGFPSFCFMIFNTRFKNDDRRLHGHIIERTLFNSATHFLNNFHSIISL